MQSFKNCIGWFGNNTVDGQFVEEPLDAWLGEGFSFLLTLLFVVICYSLCLEMSIVTVLLHCNSAL